MLPSGLFYLEHHIMTTNTFHYAGPGQTFADQPFFGWPHEYKFVVQSDIDPQAPALLVNTIQSWLGDRGERRAGWRTYLGAGHQFILVSIKNPDTALLFKLTFGGAA